MITTKVTLKNIKHMPSLSEETECFSATIYIDDKKRGTVNNRGTGGCNDYHPPDLEKDLNAIAKTLPKWKSEYKPYKEYEHDADTMIGSLLEEMLIEKGLRRIRKLAKKIDERIAKTPKEG